MSQEEPANDVARDGDGEMENSGPIITLENFNPTSHAEPILTSPRSVDACRRQGIKPRELIKITRAEAKAMLKGNNKAHDEGFVELFTQHLEERRAEKLKLLITERQDIIELEKNGQWKPTGSAMFQGNGSADGLKGQSMMNATQHGKTQSGTMGLVEREKALVEKMQRRQEKELQMMSEFEIKTEEIRRQGEERMMKQKEREHMIEMDKQRHKKEAEDRRRKQDEEKMAREAKEDEERNKLAKEARRKEEEKAHRDRELEEVRRKESNRKEEERKKKQEELTKQTEGILAEQQRKLEERKAKMEEQEAIRRTNMERQEAERRKIAEQAQREHEERINLAKTKNDEILIQKRVDYERRQDKVEERRKKFEEENQKRMEEAAKRAREREEGIKKCLETNNAMEDKKREEYFKREEENAKRKAQLEKIHEEQARRKAAELAGKEAKRVDVLKNNDERLATRIGAYVKQLNATDEKVQRVQAAKAKELNNRQNSEFIKRFDKEENVKRNLEIQEYEKQKILEKIEEDNARTAQMRREKEALIEMRRRLRDKMSFKKEQMVQDFEKQKKKKMRSSMNGTGEFHDGEGHEENGEEGSPERQEAGANGARGNNDEDN